MTCVCLEQRRPDPPEPWQPQPAPDPEPQPGGPGLASILVVEDDDTVCEVVARMLMDAGYDVITASDGREALDVMERHPELDLLITDIRMPTMGGHDLSSQAIGRRPDLPIIYISGYPADWNPATAVGEARAFLRKPFTELDLLHAVKRLLRERRP